MIQIINKNQTPPTSVKFLTEIDEYNSATKVYVAKGCSSFNKSHWILRYEPSHTSGNYRGWIFRYFDEPGGMSGHFDTIQKAIAAAFKFADIFEFETFKEAYEFIAKKN